MKNLWAPWREDYVKNVDKLKGCFLCNCLKTKSELKNLIVYKGKHSFIVLNRYPYNNGHLMIAPFKHIGNIEDLSEDEAKEIFLLGRKIIPILKEVYNAQGFNVGLNLGRCAGAGVVDHLHLHIVPRWEGDTNYMPVVGATKIIPESIEESYKRIKSAIQKSW
jgi:ATP adenylyltransferase